MDCSGHPSLTFRHWAGVSTYTSDFSLAGTCVCGKQSLGLLFCRRLQLLPYGSHQLRPSFSRSYGCILPSSLTRVFPRTLGFSPRLPVSVLVRVHIVSLEAFLGSVVQLNSFISVEIPYLSVLGLIRGICLPYSLPPSTRPSSRVLSLLAASLHPQSTLCSTGIFACCPSPMLAASA